MLHYISLINHKLFKSTFHGNAQKIVLTFSAANNSKRLNREKVGLLLKEVDDLVAVDGRKGWRSYQWLFDLDPWDQMGCVQGCREPRSQWGHHCHVTKLMETEGSSMATERQVFCHPQIKRECSRGYYPNLYPTVWTHPIWDVASWMNDH